MTLAASLESVVGATLGREGISAPFPKRGRLEHGRASAMESNSDGVATDERAGPSSKLEAVKIASKYLRTILVAELGDGRGHISEDAASVLKFHRSYQQDDRDARAGLRKEGKDKAYQFMVRVRMPGGKLATAEQYLACARLAETVGNGTLRIRQRLSAQGGGSSQRAAVRRTSNLRAAYTSSMRRAEFSSASLMRTRMVASDDRQAASDQEDDGVGQHEHALPARLRNP